MRYLRDTARWRKKAQNNPLRGIPPGALRGNFRAAKPCLRHACAPRKCEEAVAVHLLHGLPLLRRPPAAGAAETSKECVAGSRRERVCCLLVLNLVSSTLPCIRQPGLRLITYPVVVPNRAPFHQESPGGCTRPLRNSCISWDMC